MWAILILMAGMALVVVAVFGLLRERQWKAELVSGGALIDAAAGCGCWRCYWWSGWPSGGMYTIDTRNLAGNSDAGQFGGAKGEVSGGMQRPFFPEEEYRSRIQRTPAYGLKG